MKMETMKEELSAVLFHFLNDFFNGPLFCPNLSAGDQVSLRIHIQQRTDAEHRADKA